MKRLWSRPHRLCNVLLAGYDGNTGGSCPTAVARSHRRDARPGFAWAARPMASESCWGETMVYRALSGSQDRRARVGQPGGGNPRQRYLHQCAGILSLILLFLAPLQPMRSAASAHGPTVAYVALGDSLTFGLGADHPATSSYPALLARHLPPGSRVRNLAIPGITIADALDQELQAALAAHPTLATVWLGYSDITLATTPASYAKSLARLLASLRRQHARIFVANMPNPRIVPITALNPDDHLARRYNALIAAAARRYGATVVDIYTNTSTVWGKPGLVTDDDLHPTTRGYAVLARIFFEVLHIHGAL